MFRQVKHAFCRCDSPRRQLRGIDSFSATVFFFADSIYRWTARQTKTHAVNSKFALCGQNRKFGVRVSFEHLSWQTNPSPKTRTAQTCGTL